MKNLKLIGTLVLIAICFSSCSDKNSLQNYILTNAEKSSFSSSSIPKSILKPLESELTDTQKEAYEAIDRVNILAYRITENGENSFSDENKKVKAILKQKKYQELISMGKSGIIKYIGDDESIDEIVIFVSDKNIGFAVARIIGDDMTMEKFMELYKMVSQRGIGESFDLGAFSDFLNASN